MWIEQCEKNRILGDEFKEIIESKFCLALKDKRTTIFFSDKKENN